MTFLAAGLSSGRRLHVNLGWALFALASLLAPSWAQAQTADLQVSEYTWTPEPVPNGGSAVFTLRVTNNGPAAADNATVTIGVAPNFQVANNPGTDFPAFCALAGAVGAQTLSCTIAPFASGANVNFTYNATARVVGTSVSTATIAVPAGVTDNNNANNTIPPINPTVRQGVDLRVTKNPDKTPPNYVGGETVSYTIQPSNQGPNASAAVRMTDTLPPLTDLDTVAASGTNWSCAPSGATMVCNYTGAALIGNYPPITLTGRVAKNIAGTVTNVAAMSSTDALILENTPSNDGSGNVVINVAPGADLAAFKSMPAPIVSGSTFNLTLRIDNNGPFAVNGATIADTLPAGFAIGVLPGGCSAVGQAITCTSGAIGAGSAQTFTIPLTAPASPGSGSNSATVTPPGGITDPVAGNNTTTFNYTVVAPFADLSVAKTKSPNPVQAGANITSTLTITNNGVSVLSYAPGTPLVITDQIGANERVTAVSVGWSCAGLPIDGPATVTCNTTGTGTIAVGANLVVTLTSEPIGLPGVPPFPNVANTACVGGTAGSLATPADNNAGNDCASAGIIGTTRLADLRISKEASLNVGGPWGESVNVATGTTSWFYRLSVDNLGADTATTVNVSDTLPNYLNNAGFLTAITVRLESSLGAGGTCGVSGATVSCVLADVAGGGGDVRTIILEITRPVESGNSTNTATVTSPDAFDTNPNNNSDTASANVDPIADVTVNSKAVSPDPAVVGQLGTYIISYRNNGPNPASAVSITDTVDPARFEIVGTPTTTAPGGSCTVNAGTGLVTCTLPAALGRGANFQASIQIRPRFPFGAATTGFPISHTNTATIATTTVESNALNNSGQVTHNVNQPALDIRVTKVEPAGGDPLVFGDPVVYLVTMRNNGPSRATDVRMIDTPAPPVGYTMVPSAAVVEVAGTNAPGRAPVCALNDPGANQVRCVADNILANNYLDAGEFIQYRLSFASAGADPGGSLTYTNNSAVDSAETRADAAYDTDNLNDTEGETTTVLPRTDLEVLSKTTVTASPVNVNQPVSFQIVMRNNGPSNTSRLRLVETLPGGFVRTATAPATSTAGGASVTTVSCGTGNTFNCDLEGSFPAGAGNTVTLTLEARAAYPYAGTVGSAVTNSAAIQPGRDNLGNPVSADTVSANNTGTSNLTVQAAALAGNVYADDDRGNDLDPGEGLANAVLSLSGTDIYGNAITASTTTAPDGSYSFGVLPPGTYTIVETQPSGLFDSTEFAGSLGAGATGANSPIAASVCPPAANCGSGAALNTIAGINLTAGTSAAGYNFQEMRAASVAGFVYGDSNNDGQRGGGETGINGTTSPVQIRISGTDYAGNAVNVLQSTNASGAYSFTGLAPSDGSGYTITEVNEPSGFVDGRDQNGAGAGNVLAGSAGRPVGETIAVGVVNPGAALTERNFGELLAVSIAGSVYVDSNGDAIRQGGETSAITGATVTLTGTNDLGQAINCTIATDGSGNYAFPIAGAADPLCAALRPGTYTLTLTPPGGLTATGAYTGNLGGSGQAANTPLLGATTVTNIVLGSGANGSNYDFGAQGQGLSGSVYVDSDNDGIRDPLERGIPGVSVTLSGTTAGGSNVCTLIAPNPCTVVTDANGNYQFLNLPASNGTGYVLTEQSQASPPLTQYADGLDTAGTVGGTNTGSAANDSISGIVLPAGALGLGYNFGERPAGLAGGVYLDANNNGIREPGELPLAGVTITLSGTTATGANVCTVLPTCTFVTDANGNYSIPELPAGTYALTQTQPASYADGIDSPGTIGGAPVGAAGGPGTSVISNIVVPPGGSGIDYNFAEVAAGLAGRVCIDVDNDGCDVGEPPLPGVIVTLTGTAIDGNPVTRTTTTAADGSYSFTNLPTPNAGGYTLTETQPAGYASTATNTTAGSVGGSGANNLVSAIPLPAGSSGTGYNFGELQADLSLGKSVAPGRLNIGQTVTFTLQLSNAGPTLATGVVVRDQLPAGFAYTGSIASAGTSYDNSTGLWTIGTLANAQTASLNITATTLGGGPYTNVAEVSASNVPDPDSTPGNDNPAEDDRATASVVALAVVTGHVFEDRDGDQVQDPGEPNLPNLPVVIIDSTGTTQTVTTDVNGDYRADVAPGATTLNPQPPPGYVLTTNNDPQTVNVAPVATPTASPPVGYQALGGLSGSVWFDAGGASRQRDGGDVALAGWIVELIDPNLPPGSPPVRTALTDANGDYAFTQIVAGTYLVQFRDPATRVVYGTPVNGNTNNPQPGSRAAPNNPRGQLEVTIVAGQTLPQQSLPVDPSGVVYDAVTREPVAGATVTLRPVGVCTGYDPTTMLVNSPAGGYTLGAGGAVSMITAANGFYQFLLAPNAPPSCTFELTVTPPAAYRWPSSLIPASPTLAVPAGLGNFAVQPQATAPGISQSTTYHLQLVVGSATQGVIHNHIPLDPAVPSVLSIEKLVDLRDAEIGDSVRYTLRIRNVQGGVLPGLFIDDRLPLGFRYIAGTARRQVAGGPVVAQQDPAGGVGPQLRFAYPQPLLPGQTLTITYRVRLGIGADRGDGVNRAAANSGAVRSNEARARVAVRGGVFTAEACVVGKIYLDCNENQVQDPEELGVPGVRLFFEDGTYLIADSEGKYSYCGLKPITHVLKVDPSTLPRGAYLGTTGSRNAGDPDSLFVDLKAGELHRADFRIASCHAEVRDQVIGRRPVGEVVAPEVEKGAADKPAVSLDPRRETRCEQARHRNDEAYQAPPGQCLPEETQP